MAAYLAGTGLCDGKDNDGNGQTDEGLHWQLTISMRYGGYYASTAVSIRACAEPIAYSSQGGDWNNNNKAMIITIINVINRDRKASKT